MSKIKVAVVVGTRPEAIKMAPLYRCLSQTESVDAYLLSTGQHKEMLAQALNAFGLQPHFDLGLMTQNQTLPELTSRAITALNTHFSEFKPDIVLVQGDTTSVLAAGLVAFYQGIRIGHVEAGMRTGNMRTPFPEEMNRRLVAPLADWHFAPTSGNVQNLLREGINEQQCFVTGNTVIDALKWMQLIVADKNEPYRSVCNRLGIEPGFFENYVTGDRPLILVTGHRRESFGEGIENLCNALIELCNLHPQIGILFPVHLNPNVRNAVHNKLGGLARIQLINPVGYQDMVWLLERSYLIISDSGGLQCESMSFNSPLLVTRETTEYPEAIACGGCQLVGTNSRAIVETATRLLSDHEEYKSRSSVVNPYGDGGSSSRIVEIILS
jgi:UDP-N-acetylglucosamine 2-epimerase (non-hydrolysing)